MTELPTFPIRRQEPGVLPAEYETLRERGIGRVTLPTGKLAWMVVRPEYARLVLSDPRFSSDKLRPDFPKLTPSALNKLKYCAPFMINLDGPAHMEKKRSILQEFAPRALAKMRPLMRAATSEKIDALLERGEKPVDLVSELSFPVAWRLQEMVLGIPAAELHEMRDNVRNLLLSSEDEEEAMAARLNGHAMDVLKEKANNLGDDMMSRLIMRERDEHGEVDWFRLAPMMLANAQGIHNSVATMISLGVLTLLNHPQERVTLLADPDRLTIAVEEMLRFFSVNDGTPMRLATEDVLIGDTLVKAGDGLALPMFPVNRDPAVCPHPNRLDLMREEPVKHLAFGHGPHRCPANRMVPDLLEIVYTMLFERIPTLALAVPESELTYKYHSIQAFGPAEMPITW
ncbi:MULTISPECIES: cytochrome P450 [Actinomadura]|uniref:Cytochrome P450 n=1 Tax=Actinomadura litoris TaxID=2678616 RepID=A0A7K1L0N1_9ACTN|nr:MULTISPECIES: cytochrome P450 [Actinomadura]MBT2206908.1 cytochrome P450 [Actinomadura sp. NEAU-AAG7]MUN37991.1 cytochrome P450 [Actinomadura litoris]